MPEEERAILEEVQSMAAYIEETCCMSYDEARRWILKTLARVYSEGVQASLEAMFDDPSGDNVLVDNPYEGEK